MNYILNFSLDIWIITGLLLLLGILIERWLVKTGFVRDKTKSIIVVVICSSLMKQIWFYSVSWWYFMPFVILAMIFGVNRGDLWTTMNRGKWWWKSENNCDDY